MLKKTNANIFLGLTLLFLLVCSEVSAQINLNASSLMARVEVAPSPRSGSFEDGASFSVPIFLDTKGHSVNGIEVRINFDASKLSVINPTSGKSIIGIWVEAPSFDNTRGVVSYAGVVPNGIITDSGLIDTITFKAKASGSAVVSISGSSRILLNDGLGSPAEIDLGRAVYTILPKAPGGVNIFSETHPNQSEWYNNNTPTISWNKDPGVDGFSFEIDNKPGTIPDNVVDTIEVTKGFEALSDGLWYFHIKAHRGSVWSATGHFLFRVDTTPPAEFVPEANYLVAATILVDRTLISFFTTDNLSGVDHYEVGVIDKEEAPTASPVFIQAESPFQVPLNSGGKLVAIVRAVDRAGNVRDASVDVEAPLFLSKFFKENILAVLSGIILLGFLMLLMHYLFGHHIISRLRRAMAYVKKQDEASFASSTPSTGERTQSGIQPPNLPPTDTDGVV